MDTFCKFDLVRNHEIANNSTTADAKEKINTVLITFEFLEIFDARLYRLK
jgi:hypothetical protein